MQDRVLSRLDEIERLNPDPSAGDQLEAYELIVSFATGLEKLRILVERYAGSTTPIIAQSLAAAVAIRASDPKQEMAEVVLRFLANLRCWEPAETIMNSLTAVQHMLHYVDASAGDSLRHVSAFLRKCLDYDGRHWVIIKGHALSLLSIVEDRGLTGKVFTDAEILELNEKIEQLRTTARDKLGPELREVGDFRVRGR